MVTVYSYDNTKRLETPVNIGSKRKFKLMEEDYITLKFSLVSPVWFHLGDYADVPGFGRFVLVEPYKPDYNTSTGGYDYELKLEAQYMTWRNKILRFMPGVGGNECSFKLTATAAVHLELVAANVEALVKTDSNYLYDGKTKWTFVVLDGVDASAKFIEFNQTNILDALTTIAETFDCEWWFDGSTCYLGKCGQTETRDYIDFSLDDNVAKMGHSRSQEKLATRIIPFGSTRNISPRYRKDLVFTVTDSKTVNGRLRVSDSARPLSADMFDSGVQLTGVTAPANFSADKAGTVTNTATQGVAKSYIEACSASASVLGVVSSGQAVPVKFADWKIYLYFNNPRKGTQPGTKPEDCKIRIRIISGSKELYATEIQRYIYATGTTFTVSPEDFDFKADADYADIRLEITLYVGLWPGYSVDYTLSTRGNVNAQTTSDRPLGAQPLTIEVIDPTRPKEQSVVKEIANVAFNPDFKEAMSERNWLQLPNGSSLSEGTMFRIREIDEAKVKSSYFTSRYILYSNNANISKNGVVADRLMLPEDEYSDNYHIDVRSGLSEQEAVEDVVVFEDVYPRANCVVTEVIPFEAKETVENDDGTDSDSRYTAFYLKDSVFTAKDMFKDEYRIPDTDLEIIFGDCDRYTESDKDAGLIPDGKAIGDVKHEGAGKLNGWKFKVNYTKDSDGNPVWEVIRDSDSYIPNDILRPMVGDTFVIVGYDTALVDEGLVGLAEEELRDKAKLYVQKINEDTSTYDCTMMCDWAEKNMMWLYPGARVNIINEAFFPTVEENGRRWGRKSRVIGFEICLDIPADNPVFTIGEKPSYSRFGDIQSQIDSMNLSSSGGFFASSSGGGAGSSAISMLSEAKAFALANFLSKTHSDRTPYKLSSDTAFEVGSYIGGVSGGIVGIDAQSGQSFAEVDRLWVRVRALFEELTVVKAGVLAGKQYITPGGGITLSEVEEVRDANGVLAGWKCWYLAEQDGEKVTMALVPDDQVICERFDFEEGRTTQQVGNHRYWRLVTAVGTEADERVDEVGNHYRYVTLSATNCEEDSDIPAKGDEICQLGNQSDTSRQSAMVFSTVDADAPSLKMFSGISDFTLADKAVISFGTDPETGGVYFRLGSSSATQYLDYSQKGAGNQGQLTIAGKIVATSGIVDSNNNDLIGKSVVSTVILFLSQTKGAAAPTADASGWSTASPDWNAGKDIWQMVKTVYADGTVKYSDPVCVSGANGADGKPGTPGADGKDGAYPAFQWAKGTSPTAAPTTGWQSSPITSVSAGEYVWMRMGTVIPPDSAPTVWGAPIRLTGDQGTSGSDVYMLDLDNEVIAIPCDKNGTPVGGTVSESVVATVYRGASVDSGWDFKVSANGATASVNGNTVRITAISADKATVKVTATKTIEGASLTLESAISLYKVRPGADGNPGDKGDKGDTGDAAVVYSIEPSAQAVTRSLDGTPNPAKLTCSVYQTTGNAPRSLFAVSNASGFSLEYEVVKTSGTSQAAAYTSAGVTITDDTLAVIFSLYKGNDLLDRERVPVVADGADMPVIKEDIASFDYIKAAILDGATIMDGGLLLNSLIKVGTWDMSDSASPKMKDVLAGLNGIPNDNGNAVMTWGGGDMDDRFFDSNGNKRATPLSANYAKYVLRMDGSAYFCGGNIQFNTDGSAFFGDVDSGLGLKITETGGLELGSGVRFDVTNVDGLKKSLDSIANFQFGLESFLVPVGYENTDTTKTVKELTWKDAANANGYTVTSLKAKVGLWSDSFMSARGRSGDSASGGSSSSGGSGFGLYTDTSWNTDIKLTDALSASLGKEIRDLALNNQSAVTELGNTVGSLSGTLSALSGTVSALSGTVSNNYNTLLSKLNNHTHAFSAITGKPTTLAGYGITDGVNAVAVSGSGNAVTGVTVSGHTLTITKGLTFLTSITKDMVEGVLTGDIASHTHSAYVKKAGDTMTGVLALTSGGSNAYDKTALSFIKSGTTTEQARIGTSSSAGLGLYATGTIYLRPNVTLGSTSTNGIVLSNSQLTYNGYDIFHAGADILFKNSGTTTRQIRFTVGTNDYARIAAGATGENAGWMEIATADDGNEPIYVRQYKGTFAQMYRTLTLLDASGNTILPGNLLLSNAIRRTINSDIRNVMTVATGDTNTIIFGDENEWSMLRGGEISFQNVTGTTVVKICNGKVGIGILTPDEALHINGKVRIGSVTLEDVDGTLKVSGGIWSPGFVSARGQSSASGGGTSGGAGYGLMKAWDSAQNSTATTLALGANLGLELRNGISALQTALGTANTQITANTTAINALKTSLGDYVTLGTAQTISGQKTFLQALTIKCATDSKLILDNTDDEYYNRISFRQNGTEYAAITVDGREGKKVFTVNTLPVNASRYISTIATGTAPLTVLSTTCVTNLNADLLDGVQGINYAYASNQIDFKYGTAAANITTAQFIEKLTALGAFSRRAWAIKCSWTYASNDTITDTGLGNIQLAGSVIEVFSTSATAYTIRITTSPASSNSSATHAVFVYRNHGSNYSPGWRRIANTSDNVASATKLQTARTIWGQSFDGTANVSGNMTGVGTITFSNGAAVSVDIYGNLKHKDSTATNSWQVTTYDGVNLICARNDGNVGFGTTIPVEKCHINGNARAIRFISTQTTGTAPFTVASTTAVTNLNADLLDGRHASGFPQFSQVGSRENWKDCVFLLWCIDTAGYRRLTGRFFCQVDGAGRYHHADVGLWFARWSNGTDHCYKFSESSFSNSGTRLRLVTCTYNGAQYLAIQATNVLSTNFYFQGTQSNVLWTRIDYRAQNYTYNGVTHAEEILNSEVYGSLQVATLDNVYSGSLMPDAHLKYALGSSGLAYNAAYVNRCYVVGSAASTAYLYADTKTNMCVNVGNAVLMVWTAADTTTRAVRCGTTAAGTVDLGTSLYRWNGVYAKTLDAVTSVKIGSATIEWDDKAEMLKVSHGIYSVQSVSARGASSESGSASGSGNGFSLMKRWDSAQSSESTVYALGANLGLQLRNQLTGLTDDLNTLSDTESSHYNTLLGKLTDGSVTKVGKDTVGSVYNPIYLNAGKPTACALPKSGAWFNSVPYVGGDGVMEIGRYIDFHRATGLTSDYSARIDCGESTIARIFTLPSTSGTLALTSQLTDGTVTKVGTATVGASYKPVYLNAGIPTACADTMVTEVKLNGNFLRVTKNGSSTDLTIPFATNATTADKAGYLTSRSTPVSEPGHALTWYSGQPTIGAAAGNAKSNSNANADIWSFPAGGTVTGANTANVMTLRLGWSSTYFQDLFFSPNYEAIYYRSVRNGTAYAWQQLAFLTSTVAKAKQLETAQALWGQSFNGTAPVSGNMTGVGSVYPSTSGTQYLGGTANLWKFIYLSDRIYFYLPKASCTAEIQRGIHIGSYTNSAFKPTDSTDEDYAAYASSGMIATGLDIFTSRNNSQKRLLMRFTPSAQIGVLNSDPKYPLDITGQTRITSSLGDGKGLMVSGGIAATGAPDSWSLTGASYAALNVEVGYSSAGASNYVPLLAAYKRGMTATEYTNKLFQLSVNRAGTNVVLQFGSAVGAILTSGGQLSVTTAVIGSKATLSYDSAAAGLQCSVGIFSPKYVSTRGASTSSDLRLKHILSDITLTTAQIAAAPAVRFRWLSDGTADCGSIAQYWQRILPETVGEYCGSLTLDYSRAALLSAITNARTLLTHADRLRQLESEVKRQQGLIGRQQEEIKVQRKEIARLKMKLSIN